MRILIFTIGQPWNDNYRGIWLMAPVTIGQQNKPLSTELEQLPTMVYKGGTKSLEKFVNEVAETQNCSHISRECNKSQALESARHVKGQLE